MPALIAITTDSGVQTFPAWEARVLKLARAVLDWCFEADRLWAEFLGLPLDGETSREEARIAANHAYAAKRAEVERLQRDLVDAASLGRAFQ